MSGQISYYNKNRAVFYQFLFTSHSGCHVFDSTEGWQNLKIIRLPEFYHPKVERKKTNKVC